MLSPDTRTVAFELLRPPAEYELEFALLTTYTLDLEAMLGLPLSALAQSDKGLEDLLSDPILLLESLRQSGDRIHVFVDQTGIGIPKVSRELYAILESSIHPVTAPQGGTFHPKVWILRFLSLNGDSLLRVAVLSRNLTFDRSWDIAFVCEGSPMPRLTSRSSRELADFIRHLPELCLESMEQTAIDRVLGLADEINRTSFDSPEGFSNEPVRFHVLGLSGSKRIWRPMQKANRILAIAPFMNRTALDTIASIGENARVLVSSQDTLDNLHEECRSLWNPIYTLDDTVEGEQDDDTVSRLSGLHAKMLAFEQGKNVTWYVGSANITAAAFEGRNVEVVASMTGRKRGKKGVGIDPFFEAGFQNLCQNYQPVNVPQDNCEFTQILQLLEETRDYILNSNLKVVCREASNKWTWKLDGEVGLPSDDVSVTLWPISIPEDRAKALALPLIWPLPVGLLTCLVAFRLHVPIDEVEDIGFTLQLPSEGIPLDREHHILRNLIGDSERFLAFLRALLGGLEGLVDWPRKGGGGNGDGFWGIDGFTESLLENLIRVAARDPTSLEPIRRLIEDFGSTPEGSEIIPEQFQEIWDAVNKAIQFENKQ